MFTPDRPLDHGEPLFKARSELVAQVLREKGKSRSLVGEAKAGKTSILKCVVGEVRGLEGRNDIRRYCVHVDLHGSASPAVVLGKMYAELVTEEPEAVRRAWGLRGRPARDNEQLLERTIDLERDPDECMRLLQAAFSILGGLEVSGVIVYDNFHLIEERGEFNDPRFFEFLSQLTSEERAGAPISFLVAGRKSAFEVVTWWMERSEKHWPTVSQFGREFDEASCWELTEEEAQQFLLESGGGRLSASDVRLITNEVGPNPYPLQVIGKVAMDIADTRAGRTRLTSADLELAYGSRLFPWLKEIFDRLGTLEKIAVESQVWKHDCIDPDNRLPRARVGAVLRRLAARHAMVRPRKGGDPVLLGKFVEKFLRETYRGIVPVPSDTGIRVDGLFKPAPPQLVQFLQRMKVLRGGPVGQEKLVDLFGGQQPSETFLDHIKYLRRCAKEVLGSDYPKYEIHLAKKRQRYEVWIEGMQ